jgi:hypothetical protein
MLEICQKYVRYVSEIRLKSVDRTECQPGIPLFALLAFVYVMSHNGVPGVPSDWHSVRSCRLLLLTPHLNQEQKQSGSAPVRKQLAREHGRREKPDVLRRRRGLRAPSTAGERSGGWAETGLGCISGRHSRHAAGRMVMACWAPCCRRAAHGCRRMAWSRCCAACADQAVDPEGGRSFHSGRPADPWYILRRASAAPTYFMQPGATSALQ